MDCEAVADDLAAEVLLKAPLAVLADRRHPLLKRKKLSLADTMGEAWTLSPPDCFSAVSWLMYSGGESFRCRP